ncbi:bifunctional 5,10-methylenetetrahydrofolate dehydrogenase/5,10-methenyltetrahydrofolate cyclohydrolase [Cellulomonas palmilytica]|uniref:bifunctional 5,10-methylenetetrahydrofolate dehydrogenase/5,10-methenyltetrahydrofolate cyclohydrolase n=1 Tax=Cellulomonas palmilytica TaxID=2608402 RepID=UPI001F3FA193|nr:bifunctional 5,10-methylenetetrahydrofolate dehydrogenase/5,10-methenyltetrahydrofolate cyclohydrolase [Cellulomonas palmilytica]UJP40456.1 bifunctional 5,10-methylenetetrahydrofolate dehydrogenase/5,10-methenyltetrahydrofolate cyclohydrolase [Cellulomonas palmilytica]
MTATLIDGRSLQRSLVAPAVAAAAAAGVRPRVTLISVDNPNPMLAVNRGLHVRTLSAYGIDCDDVTLGPDTVLDELLATIALANADPDVHGIMVLMPLPAHIGVRDVLPAIAPEKELEGLHPRHSAGLLASNVREDDAVLPLVGEAVLLALAASDIPVEGRTIVLLTETGLMASNPVANVVARVAAPALLPLSAPFSLVPIDHPQARELTRTADVLVVSLEHPEVVTADWVRPGATVIDFNPMLVGTTTREDGTVVPVLRGGVATEDVARVAGAIMPVPGGIGPVMLGLLMRNAARAATRTAALPV